MPTGPQLSQQENNPGQKNPEGFPSHKIQINNMRCFSSQLVPSGKQQIIIHTDHICKQHGQRGTGKIYIEQK